MLGVGSVLLVASLYLILLFSIASWGERRQGRNRPQPWRYTLALGVHCTTWAFYGTITQAAHYGWWFAPTYFGAIGVFLLAHALQLRVLRVIKRHNITSIADFIATRYGKSRTLAAWIAIIALVALIPYIALQLRAITASFAAITGFNASYFPWFTDVSTLVALTMMGFAILFGARRLSLSEQHPGLMDVIAFESVIKLLAFIIVGLFVTYSLFDGLSDLFVQAANHPTTRQMLSGSPSGLYVYLTHMMLGALSMFVLPRQFQVNFIENTDESELRTARWGFPLYLFAINFFILPIALAGGLLVPHAQGSDTFMLALPIFAEQPLISMIAFIGGLSAATSMVIMSTLALSIMIANDLLTPFWVRRKRGSTSPIQLTSQRILLIRRAGIIAIIALAWGYHQLTEAGLPLVSNGVIAMALLVQLAPSMLGAIIWRQGNIYGTLAGLASGTLAWFILLLWPSLSVAIPAIDSTFERQLSQGILLSLGLNLLLYISVSWLTRTRLHPTQAQLALTATYLDPNARSELPTHHVTAQLSWGRLRSLLARFVGENDIVALEKRLNTPLFSEPGDALVAPVLVVQIERELAGAIGSPASRLLFESLEQQPDVPIDHVVNWATAASRVYKFNRELLQASVENIPQGISVIDSDLRLVAWNRRYLEMFDYPAQHIAAGMPVEELLRYNASRGLFGKRSGRKGEGRDGEKDQLQLNAEVDKRLQYLRTGSAYRYQRTHGDRVVELQGNPMPEGGFVTTYTDITDLVNAQRELKQINLELEQRVAERTEDLNIAKQAAEHAHLSKTRFFAAASHDLMQPFNAATLLCDMLIQRLHGEEKAIVRQIQQALHNAEELLRMLLEITKLDSQSMQTQIAPVPLNDILHNLSAAFAIVATDKGLNLRFVPTSAVVNTDRKLLQRILQNLLSNALRYTEQGKVLCGVRRRPGAIDIQVFDTGSGIPDDKLSVIFDEFQQLDHHADNPGIGLGLAIVERIARLLDLPLQIHSTVGRGTCFSLRIPLHSYQPQHAIAGLNDEQSPNDNFLHHVPVLAVDNDPQVLHALEGILYEWGAQVTCFSQVAEVEQLTTAPAIMVVDYHLDHGETGIDVIEAVRTRFGNSNNSIPAILNSADDNETVREAAARVQAHFMPKPLKTTALKRLLKRLLKR